MSSSAQLVLTHGTTDLQILLRDGDGRRWRATPDKAIVRHFHEWLLEHASEAEVIDLPPELQGREAEAPFTDWEGDTFALWLRDGSPDAQPERDAQGRLQLVLPKIGPTLARWLAENAQPKPHAMLVQSPLAHALQNAGVKRTPLRGVLVLSTDRGTEEQEPVATFTFLQRWLIKQGVPEASIGELVFIHPGERLESGDSPIAPAMAQRIERAMADFYDRSVRPTLLVASMGGLPQIKPLLAEIAVLLAGDKAQSLFKTEHGSVGLLPRTPIDALRVRRQCLEQVERGALLDAWTIAAPFHDDHDARRWVQPLEQAARLLNGNPVGEQVQLPALQTLIDHAEQAACLLVAIRVETALQNERWLEAINGSLTFLEAAFHDAINAWANETLAEYQPRRRLMRFSAAPPSILIESRALAEWKGRDAGPWTYQANMVGEPALAAWGKVLNNEPILRLRERIHKSVKLANGSYFKLADYRNFNTHGVMTQAEIDEALVRFMETDLWSQGTNNPAARPKPGKCFLARPLVSNAILSLIDKTEAPLDLYQQLLHELESCLIMPDSRLS